MNRFVTRVLPLALSLAGCNQAPTEHRATEHPAPKPPHCADLPELQNITSRNGSITDVRIIRIENTNLYFPAKWLESSFLDTGSPFPWEQREGKQSIGMTIPDLYRNECPGVVHSINLNRTAPEIGIPLGEQVSSVAFVNERGLTVTEIRSIGVSNSLINSTANRHMLHTGSGLWGWIVPLDDVMMYVGVGRVYPTRVIRSESLTDLAEWLATAPNRRDNARTFIVKIDG